MGAPEVVEDGESEKIETHGTHGATLKTPDTRYRTPLTMTAGGGEDEGNEKIKTHDTHRTTLETPDTRYRTPLTAAADGDACCAVGDAGDGVESGKTVVVGVRMDAQSRELLTWALVKVAEPGDRVVALHVLPSNAAAADCSDRGENSPSCSSLISLVQSFDSVLAVYEGFCNLKQIDLKLKVCRGSSLRKILVREVKNLTASHLILGVTKHHHTIRSPTSIAKHCAKKLPRECSVTAVSNGKVIFQREALSSVNCLQSTGFSQHPRNSLVTFTTPSSSHSSNSLMRTEHYKAADRTQQARKLSETHDCGSPKCANRRDGAWFSPLSLKGHGFKKGRSCSLSCDMDVSETCSCADGSSLSSSDGSSTSNCSVCASASEPDLAGARSPSIQPKEEESVAPAAVSEIVDTASKFTHLVKPVPEQRTGWPNLRRTLLHDDKKTGPQSPRTSVVHWAMRLPSRHSASAAVHPDRKPSKPVAGIADNVENDNGVIVPAATDSSPLVNSPSQEEQGKFAKELESLHLKYSSTCRLFSYKELQDATSDFSTDNLAGKGGSSRVYKGCLPDGKELAVKILKKSEDALKEFVLEVEIITTLHHKNIISLFGFCFEKENLILVYDFLSRGSLEDNLHGHEDEKSSVGWSERYKVAIGVAESLEYLHGAGNPQPVIHRDVKSSNILLSDNFEPQLSDFGLANWASTSSSHMTYSDVAGTFGYLAPEYFMYGKVNEKIDVYAFGVVLLELLTGKKPINTVRPKGQESLVMWAKPILQSEKATQLLDPNLGDKYDADQVERMILAASLCIRRTPQSRPTMALVVKLLQGDEDIVKWAKLQTNAPEQQNDGLEEEEEGASAAANIQSHLSLALLDVEDDSLSISSTEHAVDYILAHGSLEEYLQKRWSRSSSFD